MVKSTIAYLFAIRKPWLIFHFGMQCVGKYAGFWMGRHYEKLSRKQILKYTMNPGYWDMREMFMSKTLYIVIPCYNEQEVLPETSKDY